MDVERLEVKCADLESKCAELEAKSAEMLEALKSIAEFWNRDHNEKAMIGACWHAVETAEAAIAKAEGGNHEDL